MCPSPIRCLVYRALPWGEKAQNKHSVCQFAKWRLGLPCNVEQTYKSTARLNNIKGEKREFVGKTNYVRDPRTDIIC